MKTISKLIDVAALVVWGAFLATMAGFLHIVPMFKVWGVVTMSHSFLVLLAVITVIQIVKNLLLDKRLGR